jgi:hypothetical protein
MAWAEVDGSRVLVSADDKELASVFVAPESTARELVALNLSGLDRLRGTVLCDLFRGPTLQNRTPAISDGLPEAPNHMRKRAAYAKHFSSMGPWRLLSRQYYRRRNHGQQKEYHHQRNQPSTSLDSAPHASAAGLEATVASPMETVARSCTYILHLAAAKCGL